MGGKKDEESNQKNNDEQGCPSGTTSLELFGGPPCCPDNRTYSLGHDTTKLYCCPEGQVVYTIDFSTGKQGCEAALEKSDEEEKK